MSHRSNHVKSACENKLGIDFRDGKELNGWFELDGVKMARITIPKGNKPLPPKTYRSMAGQLLLTEEQLDQLMGCSLKKQGYTEIIMTGLGER